MPDPSERFDPYLQWLGIRDAERPPNHYRLLGLELFEQDADVIANAADRQMAHVRRFQNGPRSEVSQCLLNELAAAKVCLLRPELKAHYDAQLHQVVVPQTEVTFADATGQKWRERQLRRRRLRNRVVAAIAVLATVVGLVLSLTRGRSLVPPREVTDNTVRPDARAKAPADDPETPDAVDRTPPRHERRESPEPRPTATEELVVENPIRPDVSGREVAAESVAAPTRSLEFDSGEFDPASSDPADRAWEGWYPASDEPDRPVDAPPVEDAGTLAAMSPLRKSAKMERYRRTGERGPGVAMVAADRPTASAADVALAGGRQPDAAGASTFDRLRQALRARQLDSAKALLEQLSEEATSFPQRDAGDRLQALMYQLERFWDAVDSGGRVLQTGQEFRFNQQPVKVVQVGREAFVVRTADGKDETISLQPTEIPAGWAILLASLDFARRGGSAEPLVAAFLSVDREGDAEAAAELWRDLQRRGFAVPLPLRDES